MSMSLRYPSIAILVKSLGLTAALVLSFEATAANKMPRNDILARDRVHRIKYCERQLGLHTELEELAFGHDMNDEKVDRVINLLANRFLSEGDRKAWNKQKRKLQVAAPVARAEAFLKFFRSHRNDNFKHILATHERLQKTEVLDDAYQQSEAHNPWAKDPVLGPLSEGAEDDAAAWISENVLATLTPELAGGFMFLSVSKAVNKMSEAYARLHTGLPDFFQPPAPLRARLERLLAEGFWKQLQVDQGGEALLERIFDRSEEYGGIMSRNLPALLNLTAVSFYLHRERASPLMRWVRAFLTFNQGSQALAIREAAFRVLLLQEFRWQRQLETRQPIIQAVLEAKEENLGAAEKKLLSVFFGVPNFEELVARAERAQAEKSPLLSLAPIAKETFEALHSYTQNSQGKAHQRNAALERKVLMTWLAAVESAGALKRPLSDADRPLLESSSIASARLGFTDDDASDDKVAQTISHELEKLWSTVERWADALEPFELFAEQEEELKIGSRRFALSQKMSSVLDYKVSVHGGVILLGKSSDGKSLAEYRDNWGRLEHKFTLPAGATTLSSDGDREVLFLNPSGTLTIAHVIRGMLYDPQKVDSPTFGLNVPLEDRSVTAYLDNLQRAWVMNNHAKPDRLAHDGATALALEWDAHTVAVGHEDGTLWIARNLEKPDWPSAGMHEQSVKAHEQKVTAVVVAPSGIVSGSADGTVRFWSPELAPLPQATINVGSPILGLKVSFEENHLFVQISPTRARIYRLNAELGTPHQPVREVDLGKSGLKSVEVDEEGLLQTARIEGREVILTTEVLDPEIED